MSTTTAAVSAAQGWEGVAPASARRGAWARLRRQPVTLLALLVLLTLATLAAAAPLVTRYDPLAQNRREAFQPPSPAHPFGTDEFGRDLFTRVIYGGRISLLSGAAAVLIAFSVGVPLGLAGGFFGGKVDAAIMRFLDFLLAVPAILLAMAIVAVLGPSAVNATLAVAVVSVPAFARLTRAGTLTLRAREFVTAARALGATDRYLMFRTILPNTLSPLLVQVTVAAAQAILLEAALSFLGLGVRPPDPSWGQMLNTGRSFLHQSPWYGLFPGIALTLTVLSLNNLADGLQPIVDGGRSALSGKGDGA